MSVISPDGSTSMLALSSHLRAAVCIAARLRTGVRALTMWPWRERLDPVGTPAVRCEHGSRESDSDSSESDEDDDSSTADAPVPPSNKCRSRSSGVTSEASSTPQRPSHAESSLPALPTPSRRRFRSVSAALAAAAGPLGCGPASSARSSFIAVARDCRHCQSRARVAPEDPYHAFFECTAGSLPTLRVALLQATREMWLKLLASLQRCVLQFTQPLASDGDDAEDEALKAAFAIAVAAVTGLDASVLTPELIFLSYRLLWVLQWSASNVPPTAAVAASLGALFDVVFLRRSALRSFANQWVDWSVKWTRVFGEEWRRLCRPVPDAAVTAEAAVATVPASDAPPAASSGAVPQGVRAACAATPSVTPPRRTDRTVWERGRARAPVSSLTRAAAGALPARAVALVGAGGMPVVGARAQGAGPQAGGGGAQAQALMEGGQAALGCLAALRATTAPVLAVPVPVGACEQPWEADRAGVG